MTYRVRPIYSILNLILLVLSPPTYGTLTFLVGLTRHSVSTPGTVVEASVPPRSGDANAMRGLAQPHDKRVNSCGMFLKLLKSPSKFVQLLRPTIVIITYFCCYCWHIERQIIYLGLYYNRYIRRKSARTSLLVELCPERWLPWLVVTYLIEIATNLQLKLPKFHHLKILAMIWTKAFSKKYSKSFPVFCLTNGTIKSATPACRVMKANCILIINTDNTDITTTTMVVLSWQSL